MKKVPRIPGRAWAWLAAAVPISLGACHPPPIALATQFDESKFPRAPQHTKAPATRCRIRVADVSDMRGDAKSMGILAGRNVEEADSVGWLRSGLQSLGRDTRLEMVDADPSDVVIGADLLKAYIMSLGGMAKATNVVVRVRYMRHGAPDDAQIYRGRDSGVNWATGTGETQLAFDSALGEIIDDIDRDLVARCGRPAAPVMSISE